MSGEFVWGGLVADGGWDRWEKSGRVRDAAMGLGFSGIFYGFFKFLKNKFLYL